MTTTPFSPVWLTRLLRVGALLLALCAVAVWVTPVNVLGRNLIPVACGSPAAPDTARLTEFICGAHMSTVRSLAVALVLSAGALVLLSEVILARVAARTWLPTAAVVAVVAVPLFMLSLVSLFTTVAGEGADGTLIRCGTPIAPANDVISRSLCADLPARQKALSLFGMSLSAVTVLGAAYVARGGSRPQEDVAATDETVHTPDTPRKDEGR